MTDETKNKGGRPTKYNDIDLEQVRKLARKGWTDLQMSDFFEVNVATWYRWKGKHDEFCDALKEWKDQADENIERSLYERALGYSHNEDKIFKSAGEKPTIVPTVKHYPPDPMAAKVWLTNRNPDKWRDKVDVNATMGVKLQDVFTGLGADVSEALKEVLKSKLSEK